jgi:hypothetical protein
VTTSKKSDSSESSSSSKSTNEEAEAQLGNVVQHGLSGILTGPTTADLNPAYAGDPEQRIKDAKKKS